MGHILKAPYTEEDRLNFIVQYNHNGNYHIIVTETAIYALEEAEELVDGIIITNHEYIVQKEKEAKRQEILKQLDSLDVKSIRAIRAGETEYIALYEEEAKKLRKQLQEL